HRLLSGVGILLVGLTLFVAAGTSGDGAVAASSQQALKVVEQNNPAFTAFQVELFPKSGFCQTADVPPGQRLVIEYVSARIETPSDRQLTLSTTAGGVSAQHWVPLSDPYVTISNAAQAVRLYADPETQVEVCSTGLGQVTLSGHLVPITG
ncbi:MAG TPA: hypothetical protein VE669_05815, partial [Actinomycetota bacterium]|nr:hypothetical protein [Actinomycetota bacterium]